MKYTTQYNHRVQGLRLAILCVAGIVALDVPAKELKFQQAFSDKGVAVDLHYRAEFVSKGAMHQLEVWRDGERRVKRRTDNAIETYAFHIPGDPEFQMSILDLKKRINTRIDRTSLYRIGNFTDWFDLAHGLKYPEGEYRLSKVQAPEDAPKAIKACQWYDLTLDMRTTHICWSVQSRIPLLIQAQGGEVVWKVTALKLKHISASDFEIHDEGFVQNDANQDIERD